MALAIAAMTFTACEDVPEPYPYPVPKGGTGALPYQSANLNTGWTLQEVTSGAQPWSKGNSYAQATGYQKWDGASDKSNKAVEGWLISPAISTVGYENVKLSFNHTIKYTNNVTGWESYHKVYASTSFDGTNANTATWKELEFKPVASPYSDWTLYSSGEIQLPAELVGQESVYIGFWFKAPATASTTWELQSFKMMEGIAEEGDTPDTPDEGLGTAEAPLTVSKALEIINGYDNAGESKTDAFVKGIIVSVQQYNSTYKSITYYISDDGTATKQLQVYSGKGLDGADFSSKNDLKPGAVVVVKGKLKKYVKDDNVTPEINQSSTIVSIEGNEGGDTPQGEAKGDGTLNNPFNAVAANSVAAKLGDKEASTDAYYIKGKVAEIKYNYGEGKYPKTADFYISDDGTTNNTFYVYAGKYLGNKDYESGDVLKVGDEVIIYGNLYNYGGTYETAQGKAYLYSLNGKTEGGGGGGGDTPSGDAKGSGTEADPYNAIAAIQYVQALGADKESDKDIYVTGIISSIKYTYSSQYGTATYSISVNGKTANEFTVYGSYYLNNQPWKDGDTQIQLGDEVVVCGKVVNYGGNTPEFANKKNWLVSIKSNGGGGGGDTPGGQGGEVSGNTISVAASSFGLDNQAKLNTLTLTDGTTLTFNGGGNSNTPAFYTAGNGTIRMYPKNSFTINAGNKKIAAIELVCNEYNGTLYNASGNITVEGNKMTVDGTSLKASGINASSATVSNTSEGSGAATQLRIETLKITYAE